MLVGDPMSAKTKAYMLLAETLTTLAERKIPEHHEFRVNIDHPSNQQLDFLGRRCKVRSSTPSRSRWLSSTAVLTRPHMSGAMVCLPPRSGDRRQSLSYLKPQRLCQKKIELYKILDPAEGLGILGILGQIMSVRGSKSPSVSNFCCRDMATATTEERKWIVLDGPVSR